MPFQSEAQRRYIYMQASHGHKWAKKFIKDAGHSAPKTSKKWSKMTGKQKKAAEARGKAKASRKKR